LITLEDVKGQRPEWPAYKKYFMHGTSHFLGLDVHDVGDWSLPIEIGNVFTVEPGIYIREEGLGIRIENNLVITATGNDDMFAQFPIEVEEIEEVMAG
jgi:Xaa-Pro aminopeptidase